MKRMSVCALAVSIVIVAMAIPAWAASKPSLAAPANVVCAYNAGPPESVDCTWEAVPGATKYSVDVVASYDVDGSTETLVLGFSSVANSISVPVSALYHDFTLDAVDDPVRPFEVDVAVKGLNPPGKGQKSQNNPFGTTAEPVEIPTLPAE
jgi:hypothetical protein